MSLEGTTPWQVKGELGVGSVGGETLHVFILMFGRTGLRWTNGNSLLGKILIFFTGLIIVDRLRLVVVLHSVNTVLFNIFRMFKLVIDKDHAQMFIIMYPEYEPNLSQNVITSLGEAVHT